MARASFMRRFMACSAKALSSPFSITCPILTAGRVSTEASTGSLSRPNLPSRKNTTSGENMA